MYDENGQSDDQDQSDALAAKAGVTQTQLGVQQGDKARRAGMANSVVSGLSQVGMTAATMGKKPGG